MLRLLKLTFLTLSVLIGAFIFWQVQQRPTQILPLPYQFADNHSYENIQKAQNAHILILGDRMAESLNPYLDMVNNQLAQSLREPLRIFNWAKTGEGLHRTLAKVRALQKLPPLVLYLGGSQEFEEQRFYLKDAAVIAENFLRFENDILQSIILTYPASSRLIYQPHDMLKLDEFHPIQGFDSDQKTQRLSTITYQVIRYELQDLVDKLTPENQKLILSTAPINLDIEPKKVCEHTQTRTQQSEQSDIQALLKAGRSKVAYTRAKELANNSLANALNHYLKGQAAKKMGRLSEARASLQLAAVYDCALWRSNMAINNLITQTAKRDDLYFIDFDFLVNQNFGRDEVFLNKLYPQNVYYQKFMQEFINIVRQVFQL
jgi:hypothetical protein